MLSVIIGGGIGFYDGIFGPGTGTFLIFLFIRYFAFDFLQASASAKFVNIATNIAALAFFVPSGHVLYAIAVPMAIFNMLGSFTGSWVAMKHGAGFVRILFLCLLIVLIAKARLRHGEYRAERDVRDFPGRILGKSSFVPFLEQPIPY